VKIARTIAFVAIATSALIASLGAGSALGAETTLCKTATVSPYCEVGDRYAANTAFEASSSNATISEGAGGLGFECSESSLKGQEGAQSGEPLSLTLTWVLNGCINYDGNGEEIGKCAATSKDNPATLSWTSSSNGTLTIKPSAFYAFVFNCGSYTCNYRYNVNPELTFEGGHKAKVVATTNGAELASLGGTGEWTNCPAQAPLSATYTVNAPDPAYVAIAGVPHTRLCKEAQSPCEPKNTYPAGTTIEAEAPKLVIDGSDFTMTCGKTTMSAKTLALGAKPLPLGEVGFTTSNCTGLGSCQVTSTSSGSSGGASLSSEGIYTGSLVFGGSSPASWAVSCPAGFYSCVLKFSGIGASFFGGNPATFSFNKAIMETETPKGGVCQEINSLSASFTVISPKPLFAT
jgi:hypothetical protein